MVCLLSPKLWISCGNADLNLNPSHVELTLFFPLFSPLEILDGSLKSEAIELQPRTISSPINGV